MQLPHIQVGDGLLGDALLASVEVTQELNQHWWCTVVCRQTADEPIPVDALIGLPVQVRTLDADGAGHVHFSGFILRVELLTEVWESYGARLIAVSASYNLDLAARKQYYAEQTLAAVAAKACGYAGLAASVNAPARKPLNYVQYGETDFAFLSRIVDDYGCWMRPNETGLEIFDAFQSGGKLGWRGNDGTDGLTGFKVRSRLAPASFSGAHYDHHAMASDTFHAVTKPPEMYSSVASTVAAVRSASASVLPSGFEPRRSRAMTLDDYRQQLEAEAERSLGSSVTGAGESRCQELKAGNTVELEGSLEPAGLYGLTRVEHHWTPDGYSNTFACTPWKQYRNPKPPHQRDLQGVVPARVVDHNDPKKMGRVRVQFFWQTEGAAHWARMVVPHAGPERGFMFMPEVGDEVTVGFEDGDPERPIILGSTWNGVQQAPRGEFFGSDIPSNDIKRIVTKSGNRLQMVDTPGKETVVVATPNHTSMAMTEKSDATGRELVTMHSDGDIVLSAPEGRVHFQSKYFSREVGTSETIEEKIPVQQELTNPAAIKAANLKRWREHHKTAIQKAIADQRVLLLKRKAALTAWHDDTKADARKWFGSDNLATRKTLIDRTNRELALNKQMTIQHFQPADPPKAGLYAYVYPADTGHTIFLDSGFDNAPAVGTDSKAGTLAHEMSHFNDVSGTNDFVYGQAKCLSLAKTNPAEALGNADSYEYFTESAK